MSMTISKKLFTACGAFLGMTLLISLVASRNLSALEAPLNLFGHTYVHSLAIVQSAE